MPPKMKLPAPIDRPLSRAYLRQFTGWSTAYPPGVSDSTSLRVMENTRVEPNGTLRIRPGLRYLSYATSPSDAQPVGTAFDRPIVGSHEPFFLNDGSKAYLFAVRETDDSVGFRVLAQTPVGQIVQTLTQAGFSIPQGEAGDSGINLRSSTQYVKYLQIDNKIFALGDSGTMLRMFFVGSQKLVKRMLPITRPEWSLADKLTVVHPDASWVNSGVPSGTRTNRVINPSFENELTGWAAENGNTQLTQDDTQFQNSRHSMRMQSLPTRTNLMPRPLNNVVSTGVVGWNDAAYAGNPTVNNGENAMQVSLDVRPAGSRAYVYSPMMNVKAGTSYRSAFDLTGVTAVRDLGVKIRFYNASDVQVGNDLILSENYSVAIGRRAPAVFKVPSGVTQARYWIGAERTSGSGAANFRVRNVLVCEADEATTMFHGGSGTDYFWTGAANASPSVYHPPQTIGARTTMSLGAQNWIGSANVRGSVARNSQLDLIFLGANSTLATFAGTPTMDSPINWTRISNTGLAPSGTTTVRLVVKVPAVPRGEFRYVDSVLLEGGTVLDSYFDGSLADNPSLVRAWTGTAHNSTSTEKSFVVGGTLPNPETKTKDTLISDGSTGHANSYNFAFFYTFANEVGESAPSSLTTIHTQRTWSQWKWETANSAGEPSGTLTSDPDQCADQLVCYMPPDVFDNAMAAGAIRWNLYMLTWNDQEAIPVTAVRVDSRELKPTSTLGPDGWLRATPSQSEAGNEEMTVPQKNTRMNYSDPSRGGQGLVVADRMVIVKDTVNPAVIRWTSNQQGSYTDFSASRGGGIKTLTSGNLYIPASVKLWQNPQSVDTITILCKGVDGTNNAYYMAPAQIASQSEGTNIMGFEETTACPGTTSPYGCEVFNNALYHPLDDQLMKSTANNYNIAHKAQTDKIENVWQALTHKEWIVSAVHDLRLYYLVNNPDGEPLELGCNGNEIWVLDGGASADTTGGSWSRYLIQGISLRKIEQGGTIHMSVVKPDGIYYLDELYGFDDYVDASGNIAQRAIPWKIETNTQGANRAHDVWAHLQQANIIVGNFSGSMRYGIRSYDLHGRPIEIVKHVHDYNPTDELMFDLEDFLQIRRDLKEWFFFAESLTNPDGTVKPSYGQLTLVQYRYTPVSVNVGYEYGSVETFEYGRSDFTLGEDPYTTNGTPRPYVDARRP